MQEMMTRFSVGYLVGGRVIPLSPSDDHLFSRKFLRLGGLLTLGVLTARGNDIDDKDKCLSSLDGRPYTQVGGYKADVRRVQFSGRVQVFGALEGDLYSLILLGQHLEDHPHLVRRVSNHPSKPFTTGIALLFWTY